MSWSELEHAAPEIARRGGERLSAAGVALLGTLRRDGSPRISPVEPYLAGGELVFGSMAWSQKTHDLRRDPRCTLHSAVTGPDEGADELKLSGVADEVDEATRASCPEAWWHGRPREAAAVFALRIEDAVLVAWDLAAGEMTVQRWERRRGCSERRRAYP